MGQYIQSKTTINVLGLVFDSKLKWKEQVETAVKGANSNLYGIKVIRRYSSHEELNKLVTAIFFSKLYYGAEVWHFPGLARPLKTKLKFASANALRLCNPNITNMHTHTEIHAMTKRALPKSMCLYTHALTLYRLIKNQCPETEFLHLNHQMTDNARTRNITFIKNQRYEVGNNILLNRMHSLNQGSQTRGPWACGPPTFFCGPPIGI